MPAVPRQQEIHSVYGGNRNMCSIGCGLLGNHPFFKQFFGQARSFISYFELMKTLQKIQSPLGCIYISNSSLIQNKLRNIKFE